MSHSQAKLKPNGIEKDKKKITYLTMICEWIKEACVWLIDTVTTFPMRSDVYAAVESVDGHAELTQNSIFTYRYPISSHLLDRQGRDPGSIAEK